MNLRQPLSLLAVANVIPFIFPKQLFLAFFLKKKTSVWIQAIYRGKK
jgi:hypothetical protein